MQWIISGNAFIWKFQSRESKSMEIISNLTISLTFERLAWKFISFPSVPKRVQQEESEEVHIYNYYIYKSMNKKHSAKRKCRNNACAQTKWSSPQPNHQQRSKMFRIFVNNHKVQKYLWYIPIIGICISIIISTCDIKQT